MNATPKSGVDRVAYGPPVGPAVFMSRQKVRTVVDFMTDRLLVSWSPLQKRASSVSTILAEVEISAGQGETEPATLTDGTL